MTGTREAVYLPLLFLTVTLFGGVRIAERVTLSPPSLFALVLALLLIGVLVTCGALAPERLISASRSALANVNGFVLLLTTFFAAAQAFNLAIPDSGLPRVLVSAFLLVLLLNTLAAAPDRVHVLRSLMVVFGSAFTMKFIVLAALSSPADGRLKQAFMIALEGLTLGTLTQKVLHPATGYLAFFTLLIFLVGLSLLPSGDSVRSATSSLPPSVRRSISRRQLPSVDSRS